MANNFGPPPLIDRQAIADALYNLLVSAASQVHTIKTIGRRLKHWSDVPSGDQPALFLAQGDQEAQTVRGQPTIWTLKFKLYVYVRAENADDPGPHINPILNSVELALQPLSSAEYAQTLGGLVNWCRIDGTVETDEGTLGDQVVAIIPISVNVS